MDRTRQVENIVAATQRYEAWLGQQIPVVASDLRLKHRKMEEDAFSFFRGTYYRWAQLWPVLCAPIRLAPRVLAVGDLHVASFGTWRDAYGRLVWGIDDVDESSPLPYTNDLVRLAAGAIVASKTHDLSLKPRIACEVILEGYSDHIRAGGRPFILERKHRWLRDIASGETRQPGAFWKRLEESPTLPGTPPRIRRLFSRHMPTLDGPYRVIRRVAGTGSLGHPRYVALGMLHGAEIAWEAKALVPSAQVWITGRSRSLHCQQLLETAIRCRDPFFVAAEGWIVRRLAPDTSSVDLEALPAKRDDQRLLHAMARETANVHLGSVNGGTTIKADMNRRSAKWLREAAKTMVRAVEDDWKRWKDHRR